MTQLKEPFQPQNGEDNVPTEEDPQNYDEHQNVANMWDECEDYEEVWLEDENED